MEINKPKLTSYGFSTLIKVEGDVRGSTKYDAWKLFDSRLKELIKTSNEDYEKSVPFGEECPIYFSEVITCDCDQDFEVIEEEEEVA
jgi:hypothetical protein